MVSYSLSLSLGFSEIDLHVASAAAFEQVKRHSNIYAFDSPRAFHVYIDGSGGNKINPDTGTWAVAVLSAVGFRSDEYYLDKYHGAIGGRVITDSDHPAYIGASIATNNTGEISSMIWALLFVISHFANSPVNLFYNIHYDSDFSAGSVFHILQYNFSSRFSAYWVCSIPYLL